MEASTGTTIELPAQTPDRGRLARDLVLCAYVLTGSLYLGWRATAFEGTHPLWATLFYLAEVCAFVVALLRLGVMRAAPNTFPEPPPAPLTWPEIDMFVTTYGEPVAIVRRTLYGAKRVRGAARVVLLDDASSAAMEELARELGCIYLPRLTNEGAKAGNLNHGLAHSSAEFVGILDADHVPEARFLERLMGWFADPALAFVQTPQDYFNIDSYQHGHCATARHMWHEQSLFHWTEQPARHALGAATCCGCSMVIRRTALEAIGGFPTETVTEDMHAAVRLHKLGWRSAFHAEPLAYGVAPASPREFVRQRLRWGEGNMQVCRIEGVPFARNLSLAQNLSYLMLSTAYLEAWLRLIFYVAPIVYLFTLIAPIRADLTTFLLFFLPYLAAMLVATSESGRGYAPFLPLERFAMARFTAGLGATAGFLRRRIRFRVSRKELGPGRRVWLDLAPQIAILAGGIAGAASYAYHVAAGRAAADDSVGYVLVAVGLYFTLLAASVIANGLRTQLLHRDEWLCPDPIPLRMDGTQGVLHARGVSASHLQMPGVSSEGSGRVHIFLASGVYTPVAHPIGNGRWELEWPDTDAFDAFDHALLVAPWRTILGGRSERTPTFLERLGILKQPCRSRRPPQFDWGVWRTETRTGLGCIERETSPRAVLFGDPPKIGEMISIDTGTHKWQTEIEPNSDPLPGVAALLAYGGIVRRIAAPKTS